MANVDCVFGERIEQDHEDNFVLVFTKEVVSEIKRVDNLIETD